MTTRAVTRTKAAQADPWVAEMLTPITARRNPYGVQRIYPDGPGRQQRVEGDQALLVRLEHACAPRGGERPHDGLTVGELGEERVRRTVEEVEELRWGVWRIDRESEESILEALDAHFRPLQEAAMNARGGREEEITRRQTEKAERPPGWPFDLEANSREDAAIWGLPTA